MALGSGVACEHAVIPLSGIWHKTSFCPVDLDTANKCTQAACLSIAKLHCNIYAVQQLSHLVH